MQSQDSHQWRTPPKSAPKGKGVGSCEEEDPETSQNVPLGTIDLGSFEVLSDHGDTQEDDGDVDEFFEEATGILPPPPPASWFKNTETSKHNEMHCRKFRKPCSGDRRDEESPFFDCWDGKHEQSDVLLQVDPWARNAPKSVPSENCCLSVNFPDCSVCQKLGVDQHLPSKAPHYDISSEGEGQPDEIPVEVTLSDHSARACCLVSRHGVSMDKILRETLKARGVRDTLESGTGSKGVQTPEVFCSASHGKP